MTIFDSKTPFQISVPSGVKTTPGIFFAKGHNRSVSKNIKMRFLKDSESIQKEDSGPYISSSNN